LPADDVNAALVALEDAGLVFSDLGELARRDYAQLRGNQLIEKDVEHLFERGTHYLFEVKLGHKAVRMPGSEHADGKLPLPRGEVILWDNKSCEGPYPMTDAALDQFKRYIRAERDRVTLFMVVAPAFGPEAASRAERLKLESGEDTDVALITADELKWLAENWTQLSEARRSAVQPRGARLHRAAYGGAAEEPPEVGAAL
jgi:hypothetical protein